MNQIINKIEKLGIISTEEDYEKFTEYLLTLAKDESINDKKRHKAIINSNQEIIGITMKNIRFIAKYISKVCAKDFLDLTKNKKSQNSYYEETLIEGLVIADLNDLENQISRIKTWSNKIDNWSTCDSVVTSLKKLKKSKTKERYFEDFKNLCYSKKEFIARFAIVVLMTIYLNNEMIDDIFEIIKNITNDAYYVKMAIAWLIASSFLINKEKTYNLLNYKILDKFIQNKAISKCRDSFQISNEDKQNLLLYKM